MLSMNFRREHFDCGRHLLLLFFKKPIGDCKVQWVSVGARFDFVYRKKNVTTHMIWVSTDSRLSRAGSCWLQSIGLLRAGQDDQRKEGRYGVYRGRG